jgi:hypothetical protein
MSGMDRWRDRPSSRRLRMNRRRERRCLWSREIRRSRDVDIKNIDIRDIDIRSEFRHLFVVGVLVIPE